MIYSVHSKGDPLDGLAALDATRFVKEGFSWPAFAFSLCWLFYKRMWIVLAIAIAAQLLLGAGMASFASPWWLSFAAGLATSLLLGFEGNSLYRWTLARNGYGDAGLTAGGHIEDAEARFFGE